MANQNMKIENHWLTGNNIEKVSCSKNQEKFQRGYPDSIIIHYTAGRDGKSSANFLSKKSTKASAHIVVGREGTIYQLVPFDTVSWHAGKSTYNGRTGFNRYSIGIEIDNAGILEPSGDQFVSWFGKKYTVSEVVKAVHRNESKEKYWHLYTEWQIEIVEEICEILLDSYPAINQILGHEEISKGRKVDPGPAFPLDNLRNRLIMGRDDSQPNDFSMQGTVDVEYLNIREHPSLKAGLVSQPLPNGTELEILEQYQEWVKVKTEIEGWVARKYIKTD